MAFSSVQPHENAVWPDMLEFDDARTAKMLRRSQSHRGEGVTERAGRDLIPSGYEDLLRAIGYELDQRIAENVVVTELPSIIAISGFEPVLGYGESSYRPFSEPYGPTDTIDIVQRARDRRGTHRHIQTYIPPNFRG